MNHLIYSVMIIYRVRALLVRPLIVHLKREYRFGRYQRPRVYFFGMIALSECLCMMYMCGIEINVSNI